MKTTYKVSAIPQSSTSFENLLNEFSKEGWEVKAINNTFIIFKKGKTDEEILEEYVKNI